MILIKKSKEPKRWIQYRQTPGVTFQPIHELKDSLLKEQGFICAYCMRRIPVVDKNSNENHRIEHILSQDHYPNESLKYSNMVICCPGHIGDEDHCDKKKGNADISFSPFDKNFIQTLSYTTSGNIKSSNPQYDKELNEVLNLNTKLLLQNRKMMIDELIKQVNTNFNNNKPIAKGFLKKMISRYSQTYNDNGMQKYHEYCGVARYYLENKLKRIH